MTFIYPMPYLLKFSIMFILSYACPTHAKWVCKSYKNAFHVEKEMQTFLKDISSQRK